MTNKRGHTLIELAIMIAVGAILCMAMGRAVFSLMNGAIANRDYMIALNIAKQQMAIINKGTYPSVGTTNPSIDNGSGLFSGFTLTQTVTNCGGSCTSGGLTLNQVQLDVSRNGSVLVRLYTYVTNLVTFGNGS